MLTLVSAASAQIRVQIQVNGGAGNANIVGNAAPPAAQTGEAPAPAADVTTQPSATTQPEVAVGPSTRPSDEIITLIKALDSDSYSDREDAQKKLAGMDENVAPQLRGALDLELSDEARARVITALHYIDEKRDLGPSIITMHYKDAPLLEVLTDFAKQSQADMGVHRQGLIDFAKTRKISVDLDHVSFWEALHVLLVKSGLPRQPFSPDGHIVLDPNAVQMGYEIYSKNMAVSGPFAIIPLSSQENRNIMYGRGAQGMANLSLSVAAVAEPKLKVASMAGSDWLQECVDEKGNSLLPGQRMPMFFGNTRQAFWQLQTQLRELPNMGTKIARLKGELKFNVQIKTERVEIDNILKANNISRTVGGKTITVTQVTNQNNQIQVHMTLLGSQSPQPWLEINSLSQQLQLLDENGDAMMPAGIAPTGPFNIGKMEFMAMFNQLNNARPVGPPKKLIWEEATQTKTVTAPFEIQNLDLPHAP